MAKLLAEYADILVRSVNAFESKIGGKFSDLAAVEAMIPQLRQDAVLIQYNGSRDRAGSKKIDPALIQKFTIDIVPADQWDVDYLVFQSPRFLDIAPRVYGDIYVGQKKNTKGFKRVSSRGEMSTYLERGYNDIIIYQPVDEEIHVWNNPMLKQIYVEGILMDPTDLSSFDPDTDTYPLSEGLFGIMIDLFKQKVNIAIGKVQDNLSDAVDTVSKAPIKQSNV